ncbi:MAG: acyl-CoA dehydratase activase [Candidatus Muiribacteriaceae bacterium]
MNIDILSKSIGLDIGSRLTKIVGNIPERIEHELDFLIKLPPCNATDLSGSPLSTSMFRGKNFSSSIPSEDSVTIYSAFSTRHLSMFFCDTSDFYINKEKFLNFFFDNQIFITGYGKNNLDFIPDSIEYTKIPELKAHFQGALLQTGLKNFTLIDIGGQDTKVIKIRNRRMVDFVTNDKCAASSGRFLENMSAVLKISDIGNYYKAPVELNSTCAVFTESELIGLLSEGVDRQTLAASVNYSLFRRVRKLAGKYISDDSPIVFSGGASENHAICHFFRQETTSPVYKLPFSIHNGAIGTLYM